VNGSTSGPPVAAATPTFLIRDGVVGGVGYWDEEGGQQITGVLKEFT